MTVRATALGVEEAQHGDPLPWGGGGQCCSHMGGSFTQAWRTKALEEANPGTANFPKRRGKIGHIGS